MIRRTRNAAIATLACLTFPAAAACLALPIAAAAALPNPIDTLASAERAFSTMSVEQGMKPAFLANLAADGVVFQPGPVNGIKAWGPRKNPGGTLIWEPAFVEVAGNGDLGLSTGPWEYRVPAGSDSAVAFGQFVSIWKREPGGSWRLAADLGISHDRPASGGVGAVTLEPGPTHPPYIDESMRSDLGVGVAVSGKGGGGGVAVGTGTGGSGVGIGIGGLSGGVGVGIGGTISARDRRFREMAHANNEMMSTERDLVFTLQQKKSAAVAYGKLGAEDLRFYREGSVPTVGVLPAAEALANTPAPKMLVPLGSKVSTSYDFGYSYGLLTRVRAGTSKPDTSAYLHVWRRGDDGKWKLALDVENDYPKRK